MHFPFEEQRPNTLSLHSIEKREREEKSKKKKMVKGGLVLFSFFVVLVAVLSKASQRAEAAISCSDVDQPIMSCGAYLMGQGEKPPAACCSGLEKVKGMVSTQDDRRAACSCIKAAATRLPKIDESKVSSLPNECGIQISFPVSTKIDCTTIP